MSGVDLMTNYPPDRDGISDAERTLQASWRARYTPSVKELVVHRSVQSPKISLVVLSHDARDYLIECLQHARGQTVASTVACEVILADNGGLDHLRARSALLCDIELRFVEGTSVTKARNAAAGFARGEYIAFLDDDGLVAPTFVEVVCRVFMDNQIAAMRGRIVFKEHPYFCTIAAHYDRGDDMIDDVLTTEGHMAIRRLIHLESGGFPDAFYGSFHGAEGVYLAYRVQRSFPEMRIVYVPDLLMRHDYYDSWQKLIWKTRKHASLRTTIEQLVPDPDFLRYLDAYRATPKPQRALTTQQKVARSLLQIARWGVTHLPSWTLPSEVR